MASTTIDQEIPCSSCRKWDAKAKRFSCKPGECQKLSQWLLIHAQIGRAETVELIAAPIQYVV
jgi:hypothetical protein